MIPHQRSHIEEYAPRHHSPYSPRHINGDQTYEPRHLQPEGEEPPTVELPAAKASPAGRWFHIALLLWLFCGLTALGIGVVGTASGAYELAASVVLVWSVGGIGILLVRRIERDI